MEQTQSFMKSLGFPDLRIHHSINHFDFTKTDRRILIIGPMGSGKSEFSARIYRDSEVAMRKSERVRQLTTSERGKSASIELRSLGFLSRVISHMNKTVIRGTPQYSISGGSPLLDSLDET